MALERLADGFTDPKDLTVHSDTALDVFFVIIREGSPHGYDPRVIVCAACTRPSWVLVLVRVLSCIEHELVLRVDIAFQYERGAHEAASAEGVVRQLAVARLRDLASSIATLRLAMTTYTCLATSRRSHYPAQDLYRRQVWHLAEIVRNCPHHLEWLVGTYGGRRWFQ